jgi:primosomal protein N' (replication factor Y) (superfamily II helicase)
MPFDTSLPLYADLMLPVPLRQLFTYRVPEEWAHMVSAGCRVVVYFGNKRIMTGVIVVLHQNFTEGFTPKYLHDILETEPSVTAAQLRFFQWVADYYMCGVGEVMNMALPAGLKIQSQSRIQANPDFTSVQDLSETETQIWNLLKQKESIGFEELLPLLQNQEPNKIIKSLIGKRAIILFEELSDRYKPLTEKRIRLKKAYEQDEEILTLIKVLEKYPKQQQIILRYLQDISLYDLSEKNESGIRKNIFTLENLSDSALKTLVKNGILEEFELRKNRFETEIVHQKEVKLSEIQKQASEQIIGLFAEKNVVLLRGITGSGKTEIYIDLIKKALDSGSQVLLMLPEIALTAQIVSRLQSYFGAGIGIYHSKFSDNERVEVWNNVSSGKTQFVVGVRSAVFLPYRNLGLIIIDEEHESSFKQYEPAPRYHARDAAIVYANLLQARVLLGSATPSLDSYYQAQQGKYGLVEITERFGEAQLPKLELINLADAENKNNSTRGFSARLLDALIDQKKAGKQSIIFQNRRGYASYISCQSCDWVAQCVNCAVSLTYHMHTDTCVCHYCGYTILKPKACPSCKKESLKSTGTGTEKIENDLAEIAPVLRVDRMDLDTTRTKTAFNDIIERVDNRDIDVLVGTQMVAKGFDFDHVSLVGVYHADAMINFPDFRSPERAFQLLTQVAGRAGRRDEPGQVLIQTNNPANRILHYVLQQDYLGFYSSEILDREAYRYPPFTRIINILVKEKTRETARKAAAIIAELLIGKLGKARVLGPEKSLVERVRDKYVFEIWIKLERDKLNMTATKAYIWEVKGQVQAQKAYKNVQVIFNVDAV